MRQQQNNNNNNKNRMRGRGRSSNNKPSNSLNRNYESNGPDVKIRGNAAHIAEKYTTLARDALSSGDRVVAENYLQHAEHYNRIVAAANAQRDEVNAANPMHNRNNSDDDMDDQPDISMDNSGDNDGDDDGNDNESNSRQEYDNRQQPRREPRNQNRNNPRPPRRDDRNTEQGSGNVQEKPVAAKAPEHVPVAAANGEEAPAPRPRRTSRKKDVISPDAAGLRQALIGAAPVREASTVED